MNKATHPQLRIPYLIPANFTTNYSCEIPSLRFAAIGTPETASEALPASDTWLWSSGEDKSFIAVLASPATRSEIVLNSLCLRPIQ